MLPHFGHFEPRWAPPLPWDELRRTCRAVVASTGNVVSRGVPKRRAHVARRRELALMLRIESKVNERRGGATLQLQCFFVCLVCFKRGAAVLFGQDSGLNAFKVYISASCLSCINQDTLLSFTLRGQPKRMTGQLVLPIARLKVRDGHR